MFFITTIIYNFIVNRNQHAQCFFVVYFIKVKRRKKKLKLNEEIIFVKSFLVVIRECVQSPYSASGVISRSLFVEIELNSRLCTIHTLPQNKQKAVSGCTCPLCDSISY